MPTELTGSDGKPPVHVIDGSDGVWCKVLAYEVSVWPPGTESIDSSVWCVTVAYAGHDRWAVLRGAGLDGPCWRADGNWAYQPLPSDRDETWLSQHRYGLDEAMRIAHNIAPEVHINGRTAAEVFARSGA